MPLNWKATKEEHELISRLVDEVMERPALAGDASRMDWHMDIEATHCNGCPLKLAELLESAKGDPEHGGFDFVHDMAGIRRHLNRQTGELEDCFLPRFASTPTP